MKKYIVTGLDDRFKSEDRNWYKGTYLHGKIERDHEYDIFCFDRKQNLEEGIHYFQVNGKDVTFFLWKNREQREFMYPWRGYMVYSDDKEAYDDALKKYTKKSIRL